MTGRPGVLQSMGLQRVGHNLVTKNNKIVRVGVKVSYNLLFSDWERNSIYIIVVNLKCVYYAWDLWYRCKQHM